jgi:dephospho-CoA kinase
MIIGLTGKAGSGKDTAAAHFVRNHAFYQTSVAEKLKAGLAAMGFPEPADRAQKEELIPGYSFSWRTAAQRLGTEFGRGLDEEIWIKSLMQHLTKYPHCDYVISDVRFNNEADAIRAAGGVIIHLEGRYAVLGDNAAHASEAGVVFVRGLDFKVLNDGTIDDLNKNLDTILEEIIHRNLQP